MTRQSFLLRAAIFSAIAPLVPACGGKTSDGGAGATSAGGTAGASGVSGANGEGGASGSTAGTAGVSGAAGNAGAAGGGAAGAAGTTSTRITCFNPVPVTVGGKTTGVETCDDGSLHIQSTQTCPSLLPRQTACGNGMPQPGSGCVYDKECNEKPNGFCAEYQALGGDGNGACGCNYGCVTNADCGQGQVCLCGDPVGQCTQASCTSDASCAGGQCQSYDSSMGCGFNAFACHTANDSCASPKDCPTSEGAPFCTPNQTTGIWSCESGGCAIGRPFFVDAALRTARVVRSLGWV